MIIKIRYRGKHPGDPKKTIVKEVEIDLPNDRNICEEYVRRNLGATSVISVQDLQGNDIKG